MGDFSGGDAPRVEPSAAHPDANVRAMATRARLFYTLACKSFIRVSGVYIGKTSRKRLPERFSQHRQKAVGKNAAIVLVALARFADDTIPSAFIPFGMHGEFMALLYEALVTAAVIADGLPMFDKESIAGGGRMAHNDYGIVYAMVIVSNTTTTACGGVPVPPRRPTPVDEANDDYDDDGR